MKREPNSHENNTLGKWQRRVVFASSTYRLLAFGIATVQIFLFPSPYYSGISPVVLATGVGIYTLARALYPLHGQRSSISYGVLTGDLMICAFLVASTGGFYSPFLLYSLAPVVTAALLSNSKVTFAVAGLSAAYVLGSHLGNLFPLAQLSFLELSHFFLVYLMAICLAAVLPYLTNINLRQRLQTDDILRERQRLSREIHDGTVQTISVMCWQVELLSRRLAQIGVGLDEARQLAKLAERAQRDARESLEFLRTYTGDDSHLAYLKDCLRHLKRDTNINYRLDVGPGEYHLEAPVDLELVRICQEALSNIRRHSAARNVRARVRVVNNHLQVVIADDGRGFDVLAYSGNRADAEGYGLDVMRERAESVGGTFRVWSRPGRGTEVQVEVPVNSRRAGYG